MKNFALYKTPLPDKTWKNMSKDERSSLVNQELKKKKLDYFKIVDLPDNGQIVFKVLESIPASKRGLLLLDLEEQIKTNIDKGLTVWFEPIGDKSKLRNLRGIVFSPDKINEK
tara:strand:+ start:839 stop:1177 length:339 start_codon:yes stop_codon:yes gene_type:complete